MPKQSSCLLLRRQFSRRQYQFILCVWSDFINSVDMVKEYHLMQTMFYMYTNTHTHKSIYLSYINFSRYYFHFLMSIPQVRPSYKTNDPSHRLINPEMSGRKQNVNYFSLKLHSASVQFTRAAFSVKITYQFNISLLTRTLWRSLH